MIDILIIRSTGSDLLVGLVEEDVVDAGGVFEVDRDPAELQVVQLLLHQDRGLVNT